MVTGSDVTKGKPDPEVFLRCAAALGIEPAACLVLEDSPFGILAAQAAGMRRIMVPDIVEPTAEIRAVTDAVLPSLADVPAYMERAGWLS
jgi:beta-phosphoglucomutase-like phosphatase (HAD superfamily)